MNIRQNRIEIIYVELLYKRKQTWRWYKIINNTSIFPDSFSYSSWVLRWRPWCVRVLMRKKKPVISNTGKLFCFNNNVSNLYNNSVVAKIYGMAYIFTLLMLRKSNKTTINKIKRQIFIGQRPFDSRLYLDISRSFKCPKSSPVVCLISYYLLSVR
jgi:hypothetical protein